MQFLLSRDRKKIVGYKRIDASMCRFSKQNPKTGKSDWVFVSSEWDNWYGQAAEADKDEVIKVPLLDKDYPLLDLQNRTSGYTFMMAIQYPLTGKHYYPPSPWYAARRWVKIAQGIPQMKAAMFQNQITLKYIVEVHPEFWKMYDPTYASADAARKKSIQDNFYDGVDQYLSGGDNAYKSIFSTMIQEQGQNGVTSVPGIKITAMDDKVKDGKLIPDSAAANSEILFALMINPALMGADSPGGPYSGGAGSGSNIREAMLVQVAISELERKLITQPFIVLKGYNGWNPNTVIRYPNMILTTLNTGANTQSVA